MRTNAQEAPWRIVRADNKRQARLNLIRDLLSQISYTGRKDKLARPDSTVVFPFTPECIRNGELAR
jgi:hypothetical protein